MAQLLEMPKLSDTMKEGVLRKWIKKEGDKVAPGELLAEVETDKATMDFESFDAGCILKFLVPMAPRSPVGAPIAILGTAGEDISSRRRCGPGRGEEKPAAAPAAPAEPRSPRARPPPPAAPRPRSAPPGARARPAPAPPPPRRHARGPPRRHRSSASPLARKLATDLGRRSALRSPAPARAAASSSATSRRPPRAARRGSGRRARAGGAGRPRCPAPTPACPPARPRAPAGNPARPLGARAAISSQPLSLMRKTIAAPAGRVEDPDPALLPDRRRRHGSGHGLPRAGQGGPRRQAVGQRPHHQGGGAGPAAHARVQRQLERRGDRPLRPRRRRHGGGQSRTAWSRRSSAAPT